MIRTFTLKLFFFICFTVQIFVWNQLSHAQSTDTCKCNYNCWRNLSETNYKYSEQELFLFLRTISTACQNNVEFSEVSNETLFKLVENNPELFLKVISNQKIKLELESILGKIENPIHDLQDVKELYNRIEKINTPESEIKEKVLAALKIAISKNEN